MCSKCSELIQNKQLFLNDERVHSDKVTALRDHKRKTKKKKKNIQNMKQNQNTFKYCDDINTIMRNTKLTL